MKRPHSLAFSFGVVGFVALAFLLFYGGASWLSGFVPWRVRLDFPFEQQVPFVPWASVVYLSMDVLLCLAPFVLVEDRRVAAFALVLLTELLLASVCFVVLPVADPFPPRVVQGAASGAFWLADTLNLERNYFPSLHVAFSVTAACAYGGRGWWLWAGGIALSTWLLHEHCLVDVVGGVVLALTAYRHGFARFEAFDWPEKLRTEARVFATLWRVGLRHRRYVLINVVLYAVTLFAPKRRALRTGYALLQLIDDVLDGDRALASLKTRDVDEAAFAERMVTELESAHFSDDDAAQLARAFHHDAPPEAHAIAVRLMKTMRRDFDRRQGAQRWSDDVLRAHHRATFSDSLDVLLVCGGASARATQLPATVELLSFASVARDLEDDLSKGLINVPEDVRLETRADWLTTERTRALRSLHESEAELSRLTDRAAAKWLAVIARSAHKYVRLQRQ